MAKKKLTNVVKVKPPKTRDKGSFPGNDKRKLDMASESMPTTYKKIKTINDNMRKRVSKGISKLKSGKRKKK